jgi:hypothetical protein
MHYYTKLQAAEELLVPDARGKFFGEWLAGLNDDYFLEVARKADRDTCMVVRGEP